MSHATELLTMTAATTTTVVGNAKRTQEDDDERQQVEIFDKTTAKGMENGLFQDSMKAIRSSHVTANRLRTGIVVAGIFTDVRMYSEVIALFYLVTQAMEERLDHLSKERNDAVALALLSLGYRFTPDYEHDLKFLYETKEGCSSWKEQVHKKILQQNPVARSYIQHIGKMTSGADVAGAAFCLWGALIIGGGAAAKPRAEALVGQKDSLHLFQSVTGPGRNQRKADFVALWDSLAEKTSSKNDDNGLRDATSSVRSVIVASCQECMQRNNDLLASVKKNPWWMKYLYGVSASAVAVLAVACYQFTMRDSVTNLPSQT